MVEFQLWIPDRFFKTILSAKEHFQVNIISKKQGESYAFASTKQPFEDEYVKIYQMETGKIYVIPKQDIKKVEVLHVPRLYLDYKPSKLYRIVEGKFSLLHKNQQIQIFDDTILRTPNNVLVVNVPQKAEIIQDKGPPILSNFIPTLFAESTIDAKHNG